MADRCKRISKISGHITTRHMGDEAFIMNLKNTKTYSLNETAAQVWSCIDGSVSIEEIGQKIIAEYDVPEDSCRTAVLEIIEQFYAEKMVVFEL